MGEKGASPIAIILIFAIFLTAFLAGGYYVLSKTKYAAAMAKLPMVGKYLQPSKTEVKSTEEAKAAQYLAQEGRLKIQEREIRKQMDSLEQQKALLEEQELQLTQKEAQAKPNDSPQKQQTTGITANNQFKRLAKMYSSMEAKKAAAIMKSLDDNSIIIILSQMKPDQAGEIISSLDPQKAAKITKIMMQPPAD